MASNAQHEQIKSALQRYSKEELVDLMEHLLRIYVLNEPVKLDSQASKPESVKDLSGLSFAQVISLLQNSLELDELAKFRVTPYTVYVSIGDAEFDINGPTPTLAREGTETTKDNSDPHDVDDDDMTPAERMDLDSKPWRRAPQAPKKAPVSQVETPSMADLFANDRPGDRGFALFDEPPTRAEEDDELPPPIAESAPGDDPQVQADSSSNDFAKTAATREDSPVPAATPAPPALAAGDKQINPSNRFASLDLD